MKYIGHTYHVIFSPTQSIKHPVVMINKPCVDMNTGQVQETRVRFGLDPWTCSTSPALAKFDMLVNRT